VKEQHRREVTNQSKGSNLNNLYKVHLVKTLIKLLIRGTYHRRFAPKYLQNYLDEYVFRFNRLQSKKIAKRFMHIVKQEARKSLILWPRIKWDLNPIS